MNKAEYNRSANVRRFLAVKRITDLYLSYTPADLALMRAAIAEQIMTLMDKSRAPRWNEACIAWRALVLDTQNEVQWAFLQGSMYPIWTHLTDPPICEWFAACRNPATHQETHPIGLVWACDRCPEIGR